MNVLTRELQASLSPVTVGEAGELAAIITFGPEFSGFKGHFPGNPVLPGACLIQAVLVMLAAQKRSPVTLKSIVSAKWFVPVRPGAELRFVCVERKDRLIETAVSAQVMCGETRVADLSLLVRCGENGKDSPA